MIERVKDAINELRRLKVIRNQQDLVERLEYNKSSVSQILNGKVPLSDSFINNLIEKFPAISRTYIYSGDGPILINNGSNSQINAGDIATRLKSLMEEKGISAYVVEKECGFPQANMSKLLNGSVQKPNTENLKLLSNYFHVTEEWLRTGRGNKLISEDELKQKTYNGFIEVKLVTTKARAGYSGAYYSEEYLKDMPSVVLESDSNHHGNYLAFEVDGDSMEPEYHKGDIVVCREIKRDLWRYKLHFKDWDFVIAHGTKGIMLKEITDHNTETGEITCHSINTEGHPDFVLNLGEVAYLYNVVEHRISGKNKRRHR